jgi:hypothetical protein
VQVTISQRKVFPAEVLELLQAFHDAGFFEESMLIGSWVMPLYREAFGIPYALRTLDIDFAVRFAAAERGKKFDLENVMMTLGYVPVTMQSGVRKYSRENFTVEFVVHRKGGREDEVVAIKKWNITAEPLPFVDILLDFPFTADFGAFRIKAPVPEAYLIQKLITAQRRQDEKKDKDLEQCAVISNHVDSARLKKVVGSLKLSSKTKTALRASCEAIDFPPQMVGLR